MVRWHERTSQGLTAPRTLSALLHWLGHLSHLLSGNWWGSLLMWGPHPWEVLGWMAGLWAVVTLEALKGTSDSVKHTTLCVVAASSGASMPPAMEPQLLQFDHFCGFEVLVASCRWWAAYPKFWWRSHAVGHLACLVAYMANLCLKPSVLRAATHSAWCLYLTEGECLQVMTS